jgi:NPCBM/NEW2 domain
MLRPRTTVEKSRKKYLLSKQNLTAGFTLGLVVLCSCATRQTIPLPPEVPINEAAGRGGFLIVNLQMAGEVLPFVLDSGTTGTCFYKSMEPRLGQPIGTTTLNGWGKLVKANVYAMPKLSLGGVPLNVGGHTVTFSDGTTPAPSPGQPVGILGYDCLQHYCVQLDFAAGKLRFLDARHADKSDWGRAFPIVPLNEHDGRPSVAYNLLGRQGPHSLIDSGYPRDGWLMTNTYQIWTNRSVAPAAGESRSPQGSFAGEKYPLVLLDCNDVESDGIGLRFLARHLVTLDFPDHTMYLRRQSVGPLPLPGEHVSGMESLDPILLDVMLEDETAAKKDLMAIETSGATDFEKTVARKLVATLTDERKLPPAEMQPDITQISLGDAQAESAEVGWLQPAANRVPLNTEIASPLLDSGKIYATGLFAHSPSRYVFDLGGKWTRLRGEAGLHSAFQGSAYGVVFVIKADSREVFRSSTIRGAEHPHYDLDLTGVKTLELITEKAQEQNGGNWALWLDPILSRE